MGTRKDLCFSQPSDASLRVCIWVQQGRPGRNNGFLSRFSRHFRSSLLFVHSFMCSGQVTGSLRKEAYRPVYFLGSPDGQTLGSGEPEGRSRLCGRKVSSAGDAACMQEPVLFQVPHTGSKKPVHRSELVSLQS